jgi:glutathione S-transferase
MSLIEPGRAQKSGGLVESVRRPRPSHRRSRSTIRRVLVGENVTVADFVAAYTLDVASMVHLLEALPNLRAYMERMYERPKAPQRIVQAFASLRG